LQNLPDLPFLARSENFGTPGRRTVQNRCASDGGVHPSTIVAAGGMREFATYRMAAAARLFAMMMASIASAHH
jgi:hypothetical protein